MKPEPKVAVHADATAPPVLSTRNPFPDGVNPVGDEGLLLGNAAELVPLVHT